MYSLNDAADSNVGNGKIYQKPGIYENVKISKVNLDKSGLNKIPFLQLETIGENGEIGKSNRMWLSTTIGINLDGTPKKMSGWDVTKRNLVDMIEATHNITRAEAKAIELVPADEKNKEKAQQMLANKVASLLVGRPFRAKFKGEVGKTGTIFATLDLVESMNVPKENSSLRFDSSRDVVNNNPNQEKNTVNTTETQKSDLPF